MSTSEAPSVQENFQNTFRVNAFLQHLLTYLDSVCLFICMPLLLELQRVLEVQLGTSVGGPA